MLVDVKVVNTIKVELKPGDRVYCNIRKREYVVRRIVENRNHTYVVFGNMWRPLTTFGRTWWKVN